MQKNFRTSLFICLTLLSLVACSSNKPPIRPSLTPVTPTRPAPTATALPTAVKLSSLNQSITDSSKQTQQVVETISIDTPMPPVVSNPMATATTPAMVPLTTAPVTAQRTAPAVDTATPQFTKTSLDSTVYTLGSGDVLRVIVFGDDQLSGEFTIDAAGHISLPLIQEIEAAGHTAHDLERVITDRLQPEYLNDPKVSVQVVEYRSIYILGEVKLPGKYPYVPNMTLLQAVAVAGGHTYRANEGSAEITRQTNGKLKKLTADTETFIMPGDTVVVKRRWF